MSSEEAYRFLDEKYMMFFNGDNLDNIIESYPYKTVRDEVNQILTYDNYLSQMKKSAQNHSNISIFASKDSFSDKNISDIASRFDKLNDNNLRIGPSRGINLFTNSISVDIIAVLMIFTSAMVIIMREKENGNLILLKSYAKGRKSLITGKIAAMLMCTCCVVILLYFPTFIFANIRYGFGDVTRQIQSVSGFLTTELNMSVSDFFLWYFITKTAVYLLVGMLFFMIMNLFDDAVRVYVVSIFVLGVEAVFYYSIKDSSRFMVLRHVNLYALLNTQNLFNTYRNLRILNEPYNYRVVAGIAAGVLLITTCLVSIYVFTVKKGIPGNTISQKIQNIGEKINFRNRLLGTGMVSNELYKIFIYRKVLLILLIAALFLRWSYLPVKSIYQSLDDVYYKTCLKEVEGRFTYDKYTFIQNKITELDKITEQNIENILNGEVLDDAFSENYDEELTGYTIVLEQADNVKNLQKGYLFYDRGYGLVTGKDRQKEYTLAIESFIILILSIFSIWTVEYSTGMNVIISSSVKGKHTTDKIKILTALLIATVIFIAVHVPWYYSVLSAYGTEYIDILACNLTHLSWVSDCISIKAYIFISCILKLMVMYCAVFIIRRLAITTKSHIQTILAGTGILVIPFIILKVLGGM